MAYVIATINLKGGLGKTTTAVAISEVLAGVENRRVLVIDLDGQTNATTLLIHELRWKDLNEKGYTIATLFEDALRPPEERMFDLASTLQRNVSNVKDLRGLDLLPSSLDLIGIQDRLTSLASGTADVDALTEILDGALHPILQGYDYIVVDCPANLGIITLNGLRIAHGYIIPTIPDVLSTYAIPQIVERVRQFGKAIGRDIVPLGTVVSKYRPSTMPAQISIQSLQEDPRIPRVFSTIIPEGERPTASAEFKLKSSLFEKYGGGNQGYFEYYRSLAHEIAMAVRSSGVSPST